MEQDIAILIADLSGYTALTETHGSLTAADLIDKYVKIVTTSLIGDCHLQERVGDEVLIVSTSPDYLLATAKVLLQSTQEEYNFLEVHGGLHYGRLLKRNNSYFGSALNLTARIASQASAGTFLCSEEFMNAVSNKSMYKFIPKGKYNFKNLKDEKELFEISLSKPAHLYIDPICRMIVNKESASFSHPDKSDVLFCSQHCLETYLQNDVLH
jgi:class 3 adenylate cyclase/YHS domain-containing protein